MINTLKYVIVGQATSRDHVDKDLALLAYTEGVPSQDPHYYKNIINIEPMPLADERNSQSLAIVDFDADTFVLARTHFQQGNLELPVYQYIFLPKDLLSGIGGQVNPLVTLVEDPIPPYSAHHVTVPPLGIPTPPTGTLNKRVTQIRRLYSNILDENFELVLTLLGAAINPRRLLLRNFPMDLDMRLGVIKGLRMLLPSSLAPRLTFSTYMDVVPNDTPLIVFSRSENEHRRWVLDWENMQVIPAVLEHPYIIQLRKLWDDDVDEFIGTIKPMDILSVNLTEGELLRERLSNIANRYQRDLDVRSEKAVPTDGLIATLESSSPPQGQLRFQYLNMLLRHALEDRDTAAGSFVAQELDGDPTLEKALSNIFDEELQSQPDAVYVFARNRLNSIGIDERWLVRLQAAAVSSLEVAINDGDTQTLASWLELISREPHSYGLAEILRQGILAAQPRARQDGQLGIQLILMAAKRDPETLELLYADDELMAALPDNVGAALQDYDRNALDSLIGGEASYFLLALSHAIQMATEPMVSAQAINALWQLYTDKTSVNLPNPYQPENLIQSLATNGSPSLTDAALDMLLNLILTNGDDALFMSLAHYLVNTENLFPRLSNALQHSSRAFEDILSLMSNVSSIENILPDGLMETYFNLLDYWEWDSTTQPMVEQLARLLYQNPDIQPTTVQLWKVLSAASEMRLESATRTITHRLLEPLADVKEEARLAEDVLRIHKLIAWNKSALAVLIQWWREYVQTCKLAQLQRLERELEGKRALENLRNIVQTTIAMRRILGINRSFSDFATAINLAYTILGSITDAFDNQSKQQPTEIDSRTLRDELDLVAGDLPPDERHILAKNLRELAQLVTGMAEKRSKPSLIRNEEAIERQLYSGESTPQGSIDIMKWMAGYLGGTHANSDEDE